MNATTVESDVVLAPETEDYVRIAAAVALAQGSAPAKALLNVPDAELGMLLKKGITLVLKNAKFILNAPSFRRELERSGYRIEATHRVNASEPVDLNDFEHKAAHSRKQLVKDGQLLPPSAMWEHLGVTRQALNKALAAKRMFTVDVGAEQYYPAFYLLEGLDRRKLEKVTQLLGDLPGWSKWQFFTTPKASLSNVTPLEALERGMLEDVKDAAEAFAER